MSCAGDPNPLPDAVVAQRAARLCAVAERAWQDSGGEAPVYVVGTEVPVPGGAAEELDTLAVTTPDSVRATLHSHQRAFAALQLEAVWPRVIALVVQPGVEFDHHKVVDYQPAAARSLSQAILEHPGLVFEAHSTDYQTPAALRALVQDHFAILKVGPGVSFALREVYWALADIAREWRGPAAPAFRETVLQAMRQEPRYWKSYYTDPVRQTLDLQYSLSDRIRYYWTNPVVQMACTALLDSLGQGPLPLTLLSQYLPQQFAAVRAGELANEPAALLRNGVAQVLRHYDRACHPERAGNANPLT